jgi:hypothetical protein
MNARIALEINTEMVNHLLTSSKEMATRLGITVKEAIDKKVKFYVKKASNNNEAVAWEIRGEEAKKLA